MYKEMKKNGMLLTALASSIALATSAAAEEEYDFNLDTISVSANKYSQDMVSLSGQAEVADEKTLDKNEIRGVKDISKVVSAVTPAVGFGSRQLTKYTIRGVNSGNIYNSGVAVYVDGIAQPFSQMNQQFNDVGSVEVLFTFDAKLIKADTNIVVFESLYSDSKELTVHADIEDEAQTVTVIVPEIKTEASTDGKKETTIGGEITIEDIVSYHNLTPGKEYVVKGTLMNKTTGKPVTVNDEPVTAEAAFTPEGRDGEVKVAFTFNSYVITETTDVVVFESLYREDVEIAVHADIEDEGQSVKVYVPEIKTTASIDGKKEITTAGKVTVEDVVSYTNLIPGTEYTIRGTLMNKATGEVFTVNGETITAEVKFTPKDRNGEVKVKFVFDASSITKSTSLVVFESLYRDDVEITTHKDIEDKDQTVTITPPPDIPKTGDTTNIPLWGALTGISLLGAGVVAFFTFRKKKEENEHER